MTKGARKPPTLCYVALGLCTIANIVFLIRLWGMAAVATEVSMRNVQLYEQNQRQLVGTEHHVVENRMGRMEERLENIFHEIKKQKQPDAAAGPQRDEQDAIKEEDRVEGDEFYNNGLEKEALDKLHQDWAQIRKGLKPAVPKSHDFEKAALELPDNDEDPPPRPRPIIVGRKTIQHAAPKKLVAKPVAGAPAVPAKPVAGAPAVPAKPVAGAPAVPAKPVAGAPAVPAKPVAGAPAVPAKPVAGAPAVPAKPVAGSPAAPAKPVAGAPAVPAKPVVGARAAPAKPVAGARAAPAKPVVGALLPAKPGAVALPAPKPVAGALAPPKPAAVAPAPPKPVAVAPAPPKPVAVAPAPLKPAAVAPAAPKPAAVAPAAPKPAAVAPAPPKPAAVAPAPPKPAAVVPAPPKPAAIAPAPPKPAAVFPAPLQNGVQGPAVRASKQQIAAVQPNAAEQPNAEEQQIPKNGLDEKSLKEGVMLLERHLFDHWGEDLLFEEKQEALEAFSLFGYNAYLSDQLSQDRDLPDYRPIRCKRRSYPLALPHVSVILTLGNDALSVVLRSLHSVLHNTPTRLLREVILVDDSSNQPNLTAELENAAVLLAKEWKVMIRVLQLSKHKGRNYARNVGVREATGPVVAIFDAHVEFGFDWVEPLLLEVKANTSTIAAPAMDKTAYDDLSVQEMIPRPQGLNWRLMIVSVANMDATSTDPSSNFLSPVVSDGIVADRGFLTSLGPFDEGIESSDVGQVELTLRVWQCGGRMVVVPCSHVSHLSRWDADEDPNTEYSLMNEVVRVATIWLPNYLHVVRMAWDLPSNHEMEIGDVSSRVAMRDRMQCQNFAWFVKKVFPMLSMITDITSYGVLKNGEKEELCLDQEDASTKKPIMNMCNNLSTQRVYLVITGQIIVGGLDFEMMSPMRTCLTENRTLKQVVLVPCSSEQTKDLNSFWFFEQGGEIKSRATENCLQLTRDNNALFKMSLILGSCTAQTWEIVPNKVHE